MRARSSLLAGLAIVTSSLTATAQPVLVTAAKTVGPTDTTITPTSGGPPVPLATAEITVQNATLTINGRHVVASLTLVGNGVVNHSAAFTHDYSGDGSDVVEGFDLTTTGNISVPAGTRIDVNGLGHPIGAGPGAGQSGIAGAGSGAGGGHGGIGANSSSGRLGGDSYGSFMQPSLMGSGGGTTSSGAGGGAGGGRVRLAVGGALTLGGIIRATGNNGSTNGGCGSGGSIWISAADLSGAGSVEAHGGTTIANGGGGRIAVYAPVSTFTGSILAREGNDGGAGTGTVYTELAGNKNLIFDGLVADSGETTLGADMDLPDVALTLRNGAKIALRGENEFASLLMQSSSRISQVAAGDPVHVTIAGNASIEATASIDVTGRGFPVNQGPGAGAMGIPEATTGAGGGHGGRGDDSTVGRAGGQPYGSITQPVEQGSGGGTSSAGTFGGSGGGAVRLIVSGGLTLDGVIRANGNNTGSSNGGSGAGGSIWITSGPFSGAGLIEANGGHTVSNGGGGRVAIHAASSTYAGAHTAREGNDGGSGTGTVYTDFGGTKTLLFDGLGAGADSVQPASMSFDDVNLVIRGGARPMFSGTNSFNSLLMQTGGAMTQTANSGALVVNIANDATIEATATINLNGTGFPGSQGPGAGQNGTVGASNGSGAGYGGTGMASAGHPGGQPYGSLTQPIDPGSGGGASVAGVPGGAGGGAIKLTVGGVLTHNGAITANGLGGGISSGAGSGGGIWISAGTVTGAGTIAANGNGSGFDGAGGRVAIYSCNYSLTPAQVVALAGAGGATAGTIHLATATAEAEPEFACRGDTITLNVVSVGNPGAIQWRHQGNIIADGIAPSGAVFSGAATATLTISNAQSSEAGDYDAVVSGSCGGATTNSVTLFIDCCPDVNCDGSPDQGDVACMILAVAGDTACICQDPDFNQDGSADQGDVAAIIGVVAGQACP